jgi:hypothetical protein
MSVEVVADHKGRPLPNTMTDRELLEEVLLKLRVFEDFGEDVAKKLAGHPMLAAFM